MKDEVYISFNMLPALMGHEMYIGRLSIYEIWIKANTKYYRWNTGAAIFDGQMIYGVYLYEEDAIMFKLTFSL